MKISYLSMIFFMSLLIISCETVKYQNKARTTFTTAKTLEVYGPGVIQNPVLVDLDVKDVKVTGMVVENSLNTIDNLKNLAVAVAIKNANADVLVEPTFEIVTVDDKTKVTVYGFPANYKNFRPLKKEDLAIIDVGITSKAKVYEPVKTEILIDSTVIKKNENVKKSDKSKKGINFIIGFGITLVAVFLASVLSSI